jgi:hypothetical protein
VSQISQNPQHASADADESVARLQAPLPAPTRTPSDRWQGWAFFGAIVMALMGLFWALLGLVALVDDSYFVVRVNRLVAIDTYAPWGWVHLIGGLVAAAAGIGILWGGHRWARITGIVIAGLSAVVNLGFLAASPVWSTLLIALDVLVIFALTVHGWEIDER